MKAFALAVALVALGCRSEPPRVTVGVAASLRNVMPELAERYREISGVHVDVTYAASDLLGDQVKRGITHDALVLAEQAALDDLANSGVISSEHRYAIATNAIVLVGPAASSHTFEGLGALPDTAKIAIGDPETVPVGRYAKVYLTKLGVWESVEPRLVYGGDVAGVLALARKGTARLAIVYQTDAVNAAPLVVLDQAHGAPVAIAGGVVTTSKRAVAADRLLRFLVSKAGRAILSRHGFAPANQ